MGRRAVERELRRDVGLGTDRRGLVAIGRVPMQANVQVVELPIQGHIHLADDGFFGRRAVEPNGARQLVFFHGRLDSQRRRQRAGAQARMATGMSRCARRNRIALGFDLLAHARQGIVFGQDADNGLAVPKAGHEGRRHVGHARTNLEARRSQLIDQQRGGAMFFEPQFGIVPKVLIDRPQFVAERIDQFNGRTLRGAQRLGSWCGGSKQQPDKANGHGADHGLAPR